MADIADENVAALRSAIQKSMRPADLERLMNTLAILDKLTEPESEPLVLESDRTTCQPEMKYILR